MHTDHSRRRVFHPGGPNSDRKGDGFSLKINLDHRVDVRQGGSIFAKGWLTRGRFHRQKADVNARIPKTTPVSLDVYGRTNRWRRGTETRTRRINLSPVSPSYYWRPGFISSNALSEPPGSPRPRRTPLGNRHP
jgi:hypothetical protein